MFSIYDGRSKFYQWDKDRKLIVEDETIKQVHFANCLCTDARVCEVKDGLVDVPNELLTEIFDVRAWGYDGAATKHEALFEVEARTKPADYIYTPTDYWTAEKAVAEALEEAKANGDFKGDKGDKGDAGVIDFIVVTELPVDGDGSKIYLVPNATGENNNFDEYIFQNGLWEKIGSAGVEVNLDEYVKNTDYAAKDGATAGVVRVKNNNHSGLYVDNDGNLAIYKADENTIDAKSNGYKPIVPNMLDYAVKSGLADSKLEWTDEEKTTARTQLGAVGTTDYATKDIGGVVKVDDRYGTRMVNGVIDICAANNSLIDNRTVHLNSLYSAGQNFRYPIVPSNLDYAVKKALSDCKLGDTEAAWTDEEKAKAREQIGVGIADYSTPGLVKPSAWHGIILGDSSGTINLVNTTEAHINNRGDNGGQRVAITTSILDYAVKQALTNPLNTTWTEEEKAAARALLGIE